MLNADKFIAWLSWTQSYVVNYVKLNHASYALLLCLQAKKYSFACYNCSLTKNFYIDGS